jgi:tetratricopeptide (TPR) repeat protein
MKEPDNETPEALLQAGIQALKAGERQDAQNLIFKAIARKPTYVKAWLWMSEAYTELEERIRCLEQVVSLDPEDEKVQARLQTLRKKQIQGWIREGYQALKSGELEKAAQTFLRVIDAEEENLHAWWGLAHASESIDDQIVCLENVLTLDPNHTEARERLSQIRTAFGIEDNEVDTLSEVREEEDQLSLDLDDNLTCPFCGRPTEMEDRVCKTCGRKLWTREQKPSPVPLYWILGGLELGITLIGGMILLLFFSMLTMLFEGIDLQAFVSFYLDSSPTLPNVPLSEIVAPALVWLSLTIVGISLLTWVCSLSRWSVAYLIGSGLSALRTLVGVGLMVILITNGFIGKPWESVSRATPSPGDQQVLTLITWGVPVAGALVAGLSGFSMWAMMRLHTHFSVETRRMLLTIDADVARNEEALWRRAREYAKRRTWALAAIHVQRALAYRPTVERYLLLAAAYYHLNDRNHARQTLSEARSIQPDHPQIAAMIEELEQSQDGG